MFVIGSLYASENVHANTGIGRWVVIVMIFVFAVTYTATWAIVGKIYASEIQPVETRTAANSIAQGLNFVSRISFRRNANDVLIIRSSLQFTNWLVAFTTPIFLARSSYGAYFLFGGLALSTLIVLALYMPETRGISLEAIQDSFLNPNAHSIRLGRRFLAGASFSGSPAESTDMLGGSITSVDSRLTAPRVDLALG